MRTKKKLYYYPIYADGYVESNYLSNYENFSITTDGVTALYDGIVNFGAVNIVGGSNTLSLSINDVTLFSGLYWSGNTSGYVSISGDVTVNKGDVIKTNRNVTALARWYKYREL